MATIRKRGKTWRAEVRRKGYPPQSRSFDRKSDAADWAADVEAQMARGAFVSMVEAESTLLSEALDRYQREVTAHKRGRVQEESVIRRLRAHPIAGKSLAAIRGKDVAGYRDERAKAVTPATVGRELAVLRNLYTIARREWGLEGLHNPVQMIRPLPPSKARDRRLHPGELERLLEAARDSIAPLIEFTLETAMRRGELTAMRWEHVDLRRRVAHLPETKNGSARDVPLSTRAAAILRALPRRLDGLVWGIRADSITQAFDRACRRARATYEAECTEAGTAPDKTLLADLRFHDLRHEATSRLFEHPGDLSIMEVAAVTGHKDLRMLKRYTHLRAEDLAQKLG